VIMVNVIMVNVIMVNVIMVQVNVIMVDVIMVDMSMVIIIMVNVISYGSYQSVTFSGVYCIPFEQSLCLHICLNILFSGSRLM